MEIYAILLGYFDKQMLLIKRLYGEIIKIDVAIYDKQFIFAIRTQQFYTAIEDLFKQIAKSFENHIDNLSDFHREIPIRMTTEVPKIRPAVISGESFSLLDKVRAFRHFIRHAYDCELDPKELIILQNKLIEGYGKLEKDLTYFFIYVKKMSE